MVKRITGVGEWACNGQLWSGCLNRGGKLTDEKLLHDFNSMKFQAIAAPY